MAVVVYAVRLVHFACFYYSQRDLPSHRAGSQAIAKGDLDAPKLSKRSESVGREGKDGQSRRKTRRRL